MSFTKIIDTKDKTNGLENSTDTYLYGYFAGYNQAKVDFKKQTQKQCDDLLSKECSRMRSKYKKCGRYIEILPGTKFKDACNYAHGLFDEKYGNKKLKVIVFEFNDLKVKIEK